MSTCPAVILKPRREKSLLRRHPWVFSGAIREVVGDPEPGQTVRVLSARGDCMGEGAYSPASSIRVRMWNFGEAAGIDATFLEQRVRTACEYRTALGLGASSGACRLIYGEADGLPGLIVDRYGAYLVCQFLSCGVEYWRDEIIAVLIGVCTPAGIFERSDTDARRREGLSLKTGMLAGEEVPETIEIIENGLSFNVDVRQGHKTGFYLDQRENRSALGREADGLDVLNCFSFTGGFGLSALAGGAQTVTDVDTSLPALELARDQVEKNGFPLDRYDAVNEDVFGFLRRCRDSRKDFDMIVLDPPKFAESKSQIEKACRGYKDISLLALKLLRPGGVLFTFSCSGAIDSALFRKVIADAAVDSGRDAVVIRTLQQSPDHPVLLTFPEGLYLKGLQVTV